MRAFRDAGLSALVALGLFGPMLGLRLQSSGSGALELVPRPLLLAASVGLVFMGRLATLAWRARRPARVAPVPGRLAPVFARVGRLLAPILLVLAVLLPFFGERYLIDLGILVMTYVMLGWGLNIVVGLAGLLDLGYVAFYAVGAYSYGILSTQFDLGFWTCLPLAGLFAGLAGVALGFPVLRLRGDYLAIVTLGFGEIIRIVITNWTELTGGPNGISGIPRPTLFGLTFDNSDEPGTFAHFMQTHGFPDFEASITYRVAFLYFVILGLALLTNWVTLRLRRVALGRAWEALREDEIACRALGMNVVVTKLTAFAIGATFGGFAGAFFATRAAFISPESFTFTESAIVLAIVVLGGLGSQLGVALAAIVMIGGIELFRDLAEYRMLIFGLALVAMMVLRPRGIISGRKPSLALGDRRAIGGEMVAEGRG